MFRGLGVMVALVAVAALFGVGLAATASASDDCMHRFGSQQQAEMGWRTGVVSHQPHEERGSRAWISAGRTAMGGDRVGHGDLRGSTPIIPNFNASTADGGSYRVLWQMASPQGISGAALAQGQTATGKIYFDVTGGDPVAVSYDAGGSEPLMWCCSEAMMCCSGAMMAMQPMPMDDCACCTDPEPCPCCAGNM